MTPSSLPLSPCFPPLGLLLQQSLHAPRLPERRVRTIDSIAIVLPVQQGRETFVRGIDAEFLPGDLGGKGFQLTLSFALELFGRFGVKFLELGEASHVVVFLVFFVIITSNEQLQLFLGTCNPGTASIGLFRHVVRSWTIRRLLLLLLLLSVFDVVFALVPCVNRFAGRCSPKKESVGIILFRSRGISPLRTILLLLIGKFCHAKFRIHSVHSILVHLQIVLCSTIMIVVVVVLFFFGGSILLPPPPCGLPPFFPLGLAFLEILLKGRELTLR
mmetsp:Transcript_1748/g.3504  ORF Transcript_1748/g.3504 Transcript_1748/m.3504 type:complete len:273 (-) Transcript_1748:533-1351(-)